MAKTPNDNEPDASIAPTEQIPTKRIPTRRVPPAEIPTTRIPTGRVPPTEIPTRQFPTKQIPANQIPTESAPVSASAAASGGATGLDGSLAEGHEPRQSQNENIFRRHPLGAGIAAGIVAVVLISGLTAWGVGSAVTASLTSSNSNMQLAPLSTATPAPSKGTAGKRANGRLAFRATIKSISNSGSGDSTWTILTKKGKSVTVAVTGATQFGTKRMSETAASFAVGDSVVIVATKTGDTATATRVVNASDVHKGKGASQDGTMIPMPTPTSSTST